MNTSASRNRLVQFNSSGQLVHTVDADSVVVGVVVDPAINANAGSDVGIVTGGMVEVVTGSASPIVIGNSLSAAADGKVVVKASQASTDRLIALGASGAADTTIKAFLVG